MCTRPPSPHVGDTLGVSLSPDQAAELTAATGLDSGDAGLEPLLAAAEAHVPDVRIRHSRGEVTISAGVRADKPVVKNALTHRVVTGSGQMPRRKPPETEAERKLKKSAREAFNVLIPLEGSKDDRGSLPWMLDQALQFIEGQEGVVLCRKCGHENHVPGMKRDVRMLVTLLEQRLGRAPQKLEIEERSAQVIAILDGRVDVRDLRVTEVTMEEQVERQQRALKDGIVEEEWMQPQ